MALNSVSRLAGVFRINLSIPFHSRPGNARQERIAGFIASAAAATVFRGAVNPRANPRNF
jgi:hypothetical protein